MSLGIDLGNLGAPLLVQDDGAGSALSPSDLKNSLPSVVLGVDDGSAQLAFSSDLQNSIAGIAPGKDQGPAFFQQGASDTGIVGPLGVQTQNTTLASWLNIGTDSVSSQQITWTGRSPLVVPNTQDRPINNVSTVRLDQFGLAKFTGPMLAAAIRGQATVGANVTIPPPGPPVPLVEWRTDHGLTMASGNNTWNSYTPTNTYNMLSTDSHLLALLTASDTPGTPWQNGLNGVGFPAHDSGFAVSTGHEAFRTTTNPPLSGHNMTIYLVMDIHTFGNPPAPASTGPIPVFQIGTPNDGGPNTEPQLYIGIDNSSTNNCGIIIVEWNTDGSAENANHFFIHNVGNSPYLIGPTIVVVQTQRNTTGAGGQNVIFGGTTLPPVNNHTAGTLNAFTTDVMHVCGNEYINSGNTLVDMCGCTVGHVMVYNAYHNSTQIAAVTAYLHGIWNL